MKHKRAVILPVVLFVLVLIGLLAAMFAFRVHADLAATQAMSFRMQTRLAAEAGVERVKLLLRTARFDRSVWYDNPDLFNRIIVSAHGREPRVAGTSEEFDEKMVYRFSIVADDPADDKELTRFGITDESSKFNLNRLCNAESNAAEKANVAARFVGLVAGALGDNSEVDPQKIVDAIIDWCDEDSTPNGEDPGTEGDYYRSLEKPYGMKNRRFDTVEELLLVKGVTPEILYGEDFDRNGLLSESEKDGDRTFPPDNQDDVLNRGLYPYLTVLSEENNVSNDNRPRVYLLGDEAVVRAELEAAFPGDPAIVDYIVSAVKTPPAGGPGGGSGGAGGGKQGGQQPPGGGGTVQQPGTGGAQGNPDAGGGKLDPQKQRRDSPAGGQPTGAGSTGGQPAGTGTQGTGPKGPGAQGTGGSVNPGSGADGEGAGDSAEPDAGGGDGEDKGDGSGAGGQSGGEGGSGGGGGEESLKGSPAFLILPRTVDGQLVDRNWTAEELAVLMDRTTTIPPTQRTIPGLININTAPRQVLECIDGLSSDQIDAILVKRNALSGATLSTTAWLVAEGVMAAKEFAKVAPQITARGQQFTIESVGYADHIGMVTRLQVVVDMNGPIAQTVYYRDISNLGGAYPIRKEDKEKMRGR